MKRALVTGGTRGIGLAVCRLFAQKGYLVTALWSSSEEDAARAKKSLPGVAFIRADAGDEEALNRVFSEIPRLDVLVNNAGVSLYKQVQDTSAAEWERVMRVNAEGVFLCCRLAAKKMLSFGGSIVNVASVWGETGGSCESAYSASKGAVIAFSKALAKELAPAVRVNCVSPGAVDTAMCAHLTAEERRALEAEIPLGRLATPEEIAEAVLFLAEHPYITGEVLSVSGGLRI